MSDIDFLIIGAAKSATTWLQRCLQTDPAVVMPDPELHYFSRKYARGDAWYLGRFPANAEGKLVGEKSNSYLDTRGVAALIYKALPQAKLVAQLRNPVDRAYSDYCMLFRRGEVGRDIDNYLDPRLGRNNRFLEGGCYSRFLEDYLAQFPKEQLLVLSYENIKTNAAEQLAGLRSFLGLPAEPIGNSAYKRKIEQKFKDRTTPMINPELRKYVGWLKPAVAPFRNTRIFQSIHEHLAEEISYPELRADLHARLVDHYAPEVEAVRRLLGRDLPGW